MPGKFRGNLKTPGGQRLHTLWDGPPILTVRDNKRRTVVKRGFVVAVGGAAIVIAGLQAVRRKRSPRPAERRRRLPQQRARAPSRSTARTRPCRARSSAARWARTSTSQSATPRPVSARSSARATARPFTRSASATSTASRSASRRTQARARPRPRRTATPTRSPARRSASIWPTRLQPVNKPFEIEVSLPVVGYPTIYDSGGVPWGAAVLRYAGTV